MHFRRNNKFLNKIILYVFLFIVALFFLSLNLVIRTENRYYHTDEVVNLERTKFFDWYITGEFGDSYWKTEESFDQPKFSELFFGLLMKVLYKKSAIETLSSNGFYRKTELYSDPTIEKDIQDYCCSIGNLPILTASKINVVFDLRKALVLLFSIPTLILVFLVCYKVKGYLYGLSSMVIIGSNNLFIDSNTTVMSDSLLWFFSLLFVYISFFYYENIENKKTSKKLLLLLGVVSGIAISVKLNAVVLLVYFLILSLLLIIKNKGSWFLIKNMFILFFSSFLVFYITNPFLWSQPVSGSIKMVNHRLALLDSQVEERYIASSFSDRLVNVYKKTLSKNSPYSNFEKYFPVSNTISLDLFIILIGVAVFLFKQKKEKIKIPKKIIAFVLYFATLFMMTIFFIKIDWDRYYIPFILILGLTHSYIFVYFFKNLFVFLKKFI